MMQKISTLQYTYVYAIKSNICILKTVILTYFNLWRLFDSSKCRSKIFLSMQKVVIFYLVCSHLYTHWTFNIFFHGWNTLLWHALFYKPVIISRSLMSNSLPQNDIFCVRLFKIFFLQNLVENTPSNSPTQIWLLLTTKLQPTVLNF